MWSSRAANKSQLDLAGRADLSPWTMQHQHRHLLPGIQEIATWLVMLEGADVSVSHPSSSAGDSMSAKKHD